MSFTHYQVRNGENVGKATTSTSASKRKPTAKVAPKATPAKKSFKATLLEKLQPVRSRIDNIVRKVRQPRKKAKKLTKVEKSAIRRQKIRGIIGIGLLFVVVSIAYSTYMTVLFVDGLTMALALAPQVIFAAIVLFIAFYKIYK